MAICMSIFLSFFDMYLSLCVLTTQTLYNGPLCGHLILPVAMKHWPHTLKLVVYLFSPSNSLEIKGQKKKWNDVSTVNSCLKPVTVIQKSYHPAFCTCQVNNLPQINDIWARDIILMWEIPIVINNYGLSNSPTLGLKYLCNSFKWTETAFRVTIWTSRLVTAL